MSSKNYMEMSSDRKRYKYDRRKYGGIKVTTLTDGQKSLEKISKGPAVPEVRINFDRKGQMWLSYVDAEFGYIARFPEDRKDGVGKTNKTSFCLMQERWGLTRENYCSLMFRYEHPTFRTEPRPRYKPQSLYWKDLLVIDYWLAPIQFFAQIPWVLSDQYEGGFMEMSMRIHPDINLRTFRARMPPFIKRRNDPTYREIWTNNTLSNRARHFRERAGAISWAEHGVKSRIKEFLDDHVSQAARVNNSTRACRDLTLEEIHDLRKYSRERDA